MSPALSEGKRGGLWNDLRPLVRPSARSPSQAQTLFSQKYSQNSSRQCGVIRGSTLWYIFCLCHYGDVCNTMSFWTALAYFGCTVQFYVSNTIHREITREYIDLHYKHGLRINNRFLFDIHLCAYLFWHTDSTQEWTYQRIQIIKIKTWWTSATENVDKAGTNLHVWLYLIKRK